MHAGPHPGGAFEVTVVRPPRALGVITGGAISAWAFIFAAAAMVVASGGPAEFRTFLAWVVGALLLLVGGLFGYWTWALSTLRYEIDREALVIHWGLRRIVVPLGNITRLVPGRTVYEAHVAGLNWWGCHIGHADVTRVGYTLFYSTHSSLDELLFVLTDGEAFGLTVLDQAEFAEDVQANAALGPTIGALRRSAAGGIAAFPIWRDGTAKTVAFLSVLCAGIAAGYVFAAYPGLPSVVQLNYPELDEIVRIGDKSELLRIAYVSGGIAVANLALGVLFHARVRAAGVWLFASSGMLQLVLLAASIVAFSRA